MSGSRVLFPVLDYDLAGTLTSGQAFRWERRGAACEAVISSRWVRLEQTSSGIAAETAQHVPDWEWLKHYLQVDVQIDAILRTFPQDAPMRASIAACKGLRLLR